LIVAIDGPAGAGKSTIARRLAAELGFLYIDSGAMYRAVGLEALKRGIPLEDEAALETLARSADIGLKDDPPSVFLDGEEITEAIRTQAVADAASRVSALASVRRALVEKQRAMGAAGSVVMEGRDIGTVVFPEADVKIYLDAAPEIRARRRLKDIEATGVKADIEQIAREIAERDYRDKTRADSPLVQAPDAVYLDTSNMTIDEVVASIREIVHKRMAAK
jgi:cytidylate kinase